MTHHDKDPYAKQRKLDVDRNKFQPGFQTPDKYQYTDEEICNQEIPELPVENPDPPKEGFVKLGGWANANLDDRDGWKIVNMKDRPQLFKIVDAKNKNIATDFTTKENAKAYIDFYKANKDSNPAKITEELKDREEGGGAPPAPSPSPEEPEKPETDTGGDDLDEPDETPDEAEEHETTLEGPYPSTGVELESTVRGPTVRHYASGKADDKTIERNVKGIKYKNYQFVTFTKMGKMEHDDNISLKSGGVHNGGDGWYDNGVSVYQGQTCLGTEPKHPQTHACIEKGAKIGDLRNKKVGICNAYFKEQDKIELWTKLEGEDWVKQLEAVGLEGLNPNNDGEREVNEAQLRLDGWDDEPEIEAVVQPIALG